MGRGGDWTGLDWTAEEVMLLLSLSLSLLRAVLVVVAAAAAEFEVSRSGYLTRADDLDSMA